MGYAKGKYTVIYEKDGERYKLCKMFFGPDGSYYVTSPYHPAKEAVLVKYTVNYALSETFLSMEEMIDSAFVEDDEKRIKLSHHPDGFLQFSGHGIVSGKDTDGSIRGIGVMSWPLHDPVQGPAFGISIIGPEYFEQADRVGDNLLVFRDADLTPMPSPNTFKLEGYYLPALWRRFVRTREDGTKTISIVHPAGAVIELKAIFPSERCALQNFLGIEFYTDTLEPEREGLIAQIPKAGFTLSGSTGNIRQNEQGQILGDGIACMYPGGPRVVALRNLSYQPPA